MKLHILSDLHTEFADFSPPETGADVVILAGDIGVGVGGVEWAARRFSKVPVVYVPGNHEFYGHDIGLTDQLKAAAPVSKEFGFWAVRCGPTLICTVKGRPGSQGDGRSD